jgi:hypothetical protein
LDAEGGAVLGALEHIDNENNTDKHRVLAAVMEDPDVDPDALVHDGMCQFEPWAKRRFPLVYSGVKYWGVDHFHIRNHVKSCCKRKLGRAMKARLAVMNTSCCEQFNAFLRRFNFFLNGLRASSHRFWVGEVARFWNTQKASIRGVGFGRKRRNAKQRSKGTRA